MPNFDMPWLVVGIILCTVLAVLVSAVIGIIVLGSMFYAGIVNAFNDFRQRRRAGKGPGEEE